jgi:exodeoxyribonuclease-3
MRIITWNCNMAFRNKAEYILRHKPDILVVPECEHPDKFHFTKKRHHPRDAVWFGSNPNKGLGVFSYSDFRFRLLNVHNDAFRTILPIAVSGGYIDFTLFAIWANNPSDPDGAYVEQTWKALSHYESIITPEKTILAGDFNSNTIWDRPRRIGNHSAVVKRLGEKGISSCYHGFHRQEQGKEKHPTQYMYRHKDKPYHLDYCFATKDLADKIESVQVGRHAYWSRYSDHVPLIVRFDPSSHPV